MSALAYPLLVAKGLVASYRAGQIVGREFSKFGRKLGLQLLARGNRNGATYFASPVSITRYFEFPFAAEYVPINARECLDLSSPNLLSFFLATRRGFDISVFNPDARDASRTARIAAALKIRNINVQTAAVDKLRDLRSRFDCIWSISVIEHISGEYDDRDAIRWMFDALKPGGRLIITTVVARSFQNHYRQQDAYGVQEKMADGTYFFERHYDRQALEERLFSVAQPTIVRWFGENTPGRFFSYCEDWIKRGLQCTVNDPLEISRYWQEYKSWESMPGVGIVGFVIDKP